MPQPAGCPRQPVRDRLATSLRAHLVLANAPSDSSLTGAWLQVLINNGDGTFSDETSTRLAGQHDNSDHWIAFPQLIDLNGDGKLDLLTHFDGSAGLSPAFLNQGTGVFAPVHLSALQQGLFAFVNDRPHTKARDILALSDAGTLETYRFYQRIK